LTELHVAPKLATKLFGPCARREICGKAARPHPDITTKLEIQDG